MRSEATAAAEHKGQYLIFYDKILSMDLSFLSLSGLLITTVITPILLSTGKVIMNDPFAMRPFFGYNFGQYLSHWLSMADRPGAKLPKIFHVNWFRKSPTAGFLWPGFGDNIRVLDWMFRRVNGEAGAMPSAVGYLPCSHSLNLQGLKQNVDLNELFSLDQEFWQREVEEVRKYFTTQVNDDLPNEVARQLELLQKRVMQM